MSPDCARASRLRHSVAQAAQAAGARTHTHRCSEAAVSAPDGATGAATAVPHRSCRPAGHTRSSNAQGGQSTGQGSRAAPARERPGDTLLHTCSWLRIAPSTPAIAPLECACAALRTAPADVGARGKDSWVRHGPRSSAWGVDKACHVPLQAFAPHGTRPCGRRAARRHAQRAGQRQSPRDPAPDDHGGPHGPRGPRGLCGGVRGAGRRRGAEASRGPCLTPRRAAATHLGAAMRPPAAAVDACRGGPP
jgi:hypothetical protein